MNAYDNQLRTPLMEAVEKGHMTIVEVLLKAGAVADHKVIHTCSGSAFYLFCDLVHTCSAAAFYSFCDLALFVGGSVAEWLGRWTCTQQISCSNLGLPAVDCNPGLVVNTHVPQSPSSIIWYQPMGDDALRLGR